MSKKRKSKKKSYYSYEADSKKFSKKSKNKTLRAKEAKDKHKKIKLSITDKEINANRKIIHAPVEVPKGFLKVRQRCNHILKGEDAYLTVDKYKATTPAYGAYTPMLDTMVDVFGEQNVHVCPYCFEVLLNPDVIDIDTCTNAVAVMYAMATDLVNSKSKKKKDEIEEINKLKDRLMVWKNLIGKYEKVLEKRADAENPAAAEDDSSNDEMISALNSVNQARTY